MKPLPKLGRISFTDCIIEDISTSDNLHIESITGSFIGEHLIFIVDKMVRNDKNCKIIVKK